MEAKGTFTVQLDPKAPYNPGADGNRLARMTIDKAFDGDLKAKSQGEMLSAMTAVKGSAGYVALEQVTGELGGKKGGFVLQHFGTMQNGQDYLKLEVVPDSGTGELEGLSGSMTIKVEEGVHRYQFEYQL